MPKEIDTSYSGSSSSLNNHVEATPIRCDDGGLGIKLVVKGNATSNQSVVNALSIVAAIDLHKQLGKVLGLTK